ncbi:hypothetical protein [Mycolicibacterium sphagni]|uniref:hypothetical protein n=1 Tax=Mycolicibacterium sphagni TaxID=1786 RepID=UPI001055B147|nr:hypothetical protein [Mycolicibacterium sphagni]MCV7179746.1 hypothetical protein [Mycolicibacterium sphagni]
MQRAVRSSVTAGVALLGAGVIAASPIAPPVPDIHLPAIHVDATTLAAAVSPIDTYKQVFETARANLQALVDAAEPGAVLKQILANQAASFTALGDALGTSGGELFTALTRTAPEQLQNALTALAAGNVEAATNALLFVPLAVGQPLINLLPAIQTFTAQPIQSLLNVGKIFDDPVYDALVVVGLLGPVITGLGATGAAIQNVIDAVHTGDPQQVVNAILTGPATIIDGVLNGGYGPDLDPLVGIGVKVQAGGLFSPGGFDFTNGTVLNIAGPIGTLETLAQQIVRALKPSAAVTAAVLPKALPAASTTTETTPKASAKPVGHTPPAPSATKNGNGNGDSASGSTHEHKATGRGHSAR